MENISTWIYENRVSKHFFISLNFPCLSLFTALFAYVVFLFLFGSFVVRDLCGSGCRQNFANFRLAPLSPLPPPSPLTPPFSPSLITFYAPTQNSLSNTSDSYLKSVRA